MGLTRRFGPADAERLAATLAAQANGRQGRVRAMTFGSYLQSQWLPAKKAVLRPSTYTGYRRNVMLHIMPTLGRVPIRRLRDTHLEQLYQRLAHPADGTRALSPKTVLEIHLIVRAALADALRADVPLVRLHDLRHTHGTLLIRAGVPVKVVSERLGHAHVSFTITTYQHVLPGMQADAARVFEQLVGDDVATTEKSTGEGRGKRRGRRPEPGRSPNQRRRPRSLTWAFTHCVGGGGGI